MYLDFLNKLLCFPQKAFFALFTSEDVRLQNLTDLNLKEFQILEIPKLHEGNILSVFDYDNKIIKDALYYIKNKKSGEVLTSLCNIISDILLEELSEYEMLSDFRDPIIICIPSSKNHLQRRGYNPSTLIAETISKQIQIPYLKSALFKSRSTPDQKTLKRYERLKNVKHSMSINPKLQKQIQNRCVIVVDDIMTTGATLKEAKRVLLKAGVKKVIGVVVAH